MTTSLKPAEESPTEGLRRVAGKLARKALDEGRDEGMALAERIHQVRKRGKKLRALLRLVRPGFDGYGAENAAIRDMARRISTLRDLGARIESHDRLVGDGPARTRTAALRDRLARAEAAAAEDPAQREALAATLGEVEALIARIPDWAVGGKAAKVLSEGARRTYARGRDGWQAFAGGERDPHVLHDWRKRTKYHRLHAEFLAPIFPAAMEAHAALADRLAEVLGDHRDLAVLAPEIPEALDGAERAEAEALLLDRQRALEAEAAALGARLYADKPGALARRWRAWIELPEPG